MIQHFYGLMIVKKILSCFGLSEIQLIILNVLSLCLVMGLVPLINVSSKSIRPSDMHTVYTQGASLRLSEIFKSIIVVNNLSYFDKAFSVNNFCKAIAQKSFSFSFYVLFYILLPPLVSFL